MTNPSCYLAPGDAPSYGASASAMVAQIVQASALVDAYLRRPKGLVYIADANGNPAAMQAAVPDMTFTLSGSIAAGQKIVATVTPPLITNDFVGDVLVLEAGTPSLIEACLITAITGNNQVTLANVQFAHAGGATAQTGLTLVEERAIPAKRSVTLLSQIPVVNLLSCMGRYGYGRRSDQIGGLYQEMNLLAAVQTFGGPPQWVPVSVAQCSLSPLTGEVWVPAGVLLAYYSEVRLRYVAGFPANQVPPPVKMATAQLIAALSTSSGMGAGVKMAKAGDTSLERFADTNFDADTKQMLSPYRARLLF